MPQQETPQNPPIQKSNPLYVTIPFEYYRTLVEHYYTVTPSSNIDEAFTSPPLDPAPTSVGGTINLEGIDLFDEMPEGYRKLGPNGD